MIYIRSDKEIQGIRSDRVTEEIWTEVHNIVQKTVIKPSRRTARKVKWFSEEALEIADKRK